jgi:hypothetical protein
MALRQTTGFVESLLHLIDLDWTVPNFSTLSRRQKGLKVNIPYRGSQGPLHLLIPSRRCKQRLPGSGQHRDQGPLSAASCGCACRAMEGEGEWNARKHGGTKRRVWRKIHIHCPAGEWHIRREGELTNKRWKYELPSSPPATSAPLVVCKQTIAWQRMRPCYPNSSTRSHPSSRSPASPPTVPSTPVSVTKQLRLAAQPPS